MKEIKEGKWISVKRRDREKEVYSLLRLESQFL